MNGLKKGLAMSVAISALAAGALAAHADTGVTQPAAESRQYENFEQQVGMGSVATYTASEHDDGAANGATAQAQSPRSGVFHRLAASAPVRKLESALHKHPVSPSVFDDPLNTASPGG